jgi:peroxiredoxin
MKSQSLQLTRRGIWISHLAIELIAGIIILAMLAGMFMLSLPAYAMPALQAAGFLSTWLYPVLQIALIIGIVLTMSAPQQSRVAPWGLATLAVSFCANLWPIIVYWRDMPLTWLGSFNTGILTFVQALLFTAMLHQLAKWILRIEQSDSPRTTDAPGAKAKDFLDVRKWTDSVQGFKSLLLFGTIFLVVLMMFLYIPAIQTGVFQAFGATAMLLPLAAIFVFLFLLANFSRKVYRLNRLLNARQTDTQGADQGWADVPADSLRPSIIIPGALVLLSYAGYHAANYSLAPGYMQKQLAKMGLDSPSGGSGVDKAIGKAAPNLMLKTIDGNSMDLESLKGKTVVLNFWATWCGPCVAEMPSLQKLSVEMEDQKVVIIGISNEPQSTLEEFVKSKGITYPIVAGDGWPAPFDRISAIPTTYILDASGVIQDGFVGSRSYEALQGSISKVASMSSSSSNAELSSGDAAAIE